MALTDILEFAALTVLIIFLFLSLSIYFEGLLIGPEEVSGVTVSLVPVPQPIGHCDDGLLSTSIFIVPMIVMKTDTENIRNYNKNVGFFHIRLIFFLR